jgi:mono/diheme cytochrome c family protein
MAIFRRLAVLAIVGAAGAIAFLAWPRPIPPAPSAPADAVARGAYLVKVAGCTGCHTAEGADATPFAGGRAFKTPFGTFVSPNITPDKEHGIGGWTDAQFLAAMRHGLDDGGHPLYPVFPYSSYTLMTDEDVLALRAWLATVPPSPRENAPHQAGFPLSWRPLVNGWRLLFLKEGPYVPNPQRDANWNRGAYLVEAVAHCGECHTPRNAFGALDRMRWLAGTRNGPDNEKVPNITPDKTGIGDWSTSDIVTLLREGTKPDFDNVQGSMAEAVKHGLKDLTDEDAKAIATYLKSLQPIVNAVR